MPAVTPGCTLASWDGVRHLVVEVYEIKHDRDKTSAILACEAPWRIWDNAHFRPPGDAPTCLWCAAARQR